MADRMYPGDPRATNSSSSSAQMPPAAGSSAATHATTQNDTSRDEQLARELQMQFNMAVQPVLAQPAYQVPYSCGACGATHSVRNVSHGAEFTCTVCGAVNRIMLQHRQPIVVVGSAYPVPIPIFCTIL